MTLDAQDVYTNCLLREYQSDWDDAQTDLAHLGGAKPGAAKSGGDKLWEDNWDDDDIEDDFSVQLRYLLAPLVYWNTLTDIIITRNELAKKGKGGIPEPMQH